MPYSREKDFRAPFRAWKEDHDRRVRMQERARQGRQLLVSYHPREERPWVVTEARVVIGQFDTEAEARGYMYERM